MEEVHYLEELGNIIKNAPVFPGDTISHASAKECVIRGWAERDDNDDFIPTDLGRQVHGGVDPQGQYGTVEKLDKEVSCPKTIVEAANNLADAIERLKDEIRDTPVYRRLRDAITKFEHALLDQPKISGVQEPRSSYDRLIIQRETGARLYCDPYELLAALDLRSPTLDHIIKKAWNPGGRSGGKTRQQDIKEIAWTARCAEQEEHHGNE